MPSSHSHSPPLLLRLPRTNRSRQFVWELFNRPHIFPAGWRSTLRCLWRTAAADGNACTAGRSLPLHLGAPSLTQPAVDPCPQDKSAGHEPLQIRGRFLNSCEGEVGEDVGYYWPPHSFVLERISPPSTFIYSSPTPNPQWPLADWDVIRVGICWGLVPALTQIHICMLGVLPFFHHSEGALLHFICLSHTHTHTHVS